MVAKSEFFCRHVDALEKAYRFVQMCEMSYMQFNKEEFREFHDVYHKLVQVSASLDDAIQSCVSTMERMQHDGR